MHHICIAYDDETRKRGKYAIWIINMSLSNSRYRITIKKKIYVLIRDESGGVKSIYSSIPAGNNSLECLFLIFSISQSGIEKKQILKSLKECKWFLSKFVKQTEVIFCEKLPSCFHFLQFIKTVFYSHPHTTTSYKVKFL